MKEVNKKSSEQNQTGKIAKQRASQKGGRQNALSFIDHRLGSTEKGQTAVCPQTPLNPIQQTIETAAQLQRSIGNQAIGRLLIQPKLTLGPVGDKYEQEADAAAKQVVGHLATSDQSTVQSQEDEELQLMRETAVQRQEDEEMQMMPETAVQRQSQTGYGGGEISADIEQSIQSAKGSGQPLSDTIRTPMENAFGTDFSGVNIHTSSQSNTLNQSLQARAFTTGQDIFFRSGEYNPSSSGGQELIAHELTHVVQQNGNSNSTAISRSNQNKIQRDIGFEFETQQMQTKRRNAGALPVNGFPNPGAGAVEFNHANSTRINKGAALLSKADIEVQADDANFGGNSDLEVVTTHFPLTIAGRGQLDQAMTDLDNLINVYTPLAVIGGGYVSAAALNGIAGFNNGMNDGMFLGNWATAQTAGQVTLGTRLGNIGDIVKDLHGAPAETPVDKAARDPGRLHMRRPDNVNPLVPRALGANEETSTLIDGHGIAQNALAQYELNNPAAPAGGSALEGLLTIIFSYCESMQHKQAFLKNHTPLMAKTNLATVFEILPANVQAYYSTKRWGRTNFERLIRTAPGYPGRMNQPLFQGVDGLHEDDQAAGQRQWYHRLSLKSWVRGIVLRNRTLFEAINDGFNGNTMRPGTDKLTDATFPHKPANQEVEGYGALGANMDTHIGTGDDLPVFELRSANRLITYAAAHQWALDFFDYVESLNNNPAGGYARM